MAIPTFISITPTSGPAGGRSTAVITGTNFRVSTTNGKTVKVTFDGVQVPLEKTEVETTSRIRVEVPPFSRNAGDALVDILPAVDIRIANVDDSEVEIPGEVVIAPAAYTHERAPLRPPEATAANQHYTQVIKEMMANFHRQVLPNTMISTSVDYGEAGEVTIAAAELPSIALVGPRITENVVVRHQWLDLPEEGDGNNPEQFQTRWHGYTGDLEFDFHIGVNRVAEAFSLTQAVVEMFLRTPFIEVPVVFGDTNGPKHQFPLVLINAPNVSHKDMNSDLIIASGTFQIRWVPIRLPQAFQVGHEILEGEMQMSQTADPSSSESVPFANQP